MTNGLFTVSLDFGSNPFTGARRWLQIDARTNNAALPFVTLTPRTELTPTPYAIYAGKAGSVVNGGVSAAALAPSPLAGQVLGYSGSSLVWQNGVVTGPWLLNGNNAYYNSGNVGIGTTSPQSKLHVAGGPAVFDNPSGAIRVARVSGQLNNDDLGIWNRSVSGNQTFAIADYATGNKGIFVNTGSGNVGIGTTAPRAKLEVSGNIIAEPNDHGNPGNIAMTAGSVDGTALYCHSYGLPFHAHNDFTGTDVVLAGGQAAGFTGGVSVSGNVGIGTTAPKAALHVAGDYYGHGHMYLYAYGGDGQDGNAYVQRYITEFKPKVRWPNGRPSKPEGGP